MEYQLGRYKVKSECNSKVWIFNHYATDMFENHGGRHYWFAKYLIENGYDTMIFCANTYHNKEKKIKIDKSIYKIETCDNIPFVFVKTISSLGNGIKRILNMLIFYFNIFSVAKRIKKIHKPDIILASSVHPLTMIAGIKIAKKLGIPCICEIRDLWPEAIFTHGKIKENSILGKILINREHWIYKKADSLIFTKPGDIDYLKEKKWTTDLGGDINIGKCHYINNGVDLVDFNSMKTKQTIKDIELEDINKFNIIYTGAIRPVNNINCILDAAKILKDEKNIRFLIYGDGNQLKKMKDRVEKEDLNNVVIKGFVNKKYIPYILSKASVNILNYSSELYNWKRGNSSNKLFEYMASGKPIISTVKMGYDFIQKYECGISLNNNKEKDLAEAILFLKNINKTDYKTMCYNSLKASKDFNITKNVDALIEIIEQIKK